MKWRTDLEEWADEYFLNSDFVKRKTFGCPSYYHGKKLFAFLYEDALGIKLSPIEVLAKIKADHETYTHFNPGDGIMKNWLLITHPEKEDYEEEKAFIEKAMISFFSS